MFENAGEFNRVQIFHSGTWKEVQVSVVGFAPGDADIAVLAPTVQLAPTYPLEPTTLGLALGQQVYFLGFPLGMMGSGGAEINREFPMPLVKSGVFSGADGSPPAKLWIDGHNNPGFSGGPLVFAPVRERFVPERAFKVAGVITGYRLSMLPVYDQQGREAGLLPENSGIVIAHSIEPAVELINANPIGFELPK